MASTAQPHFIANRYEIRNIVGRGGMGVVYRCFDHVSRSEVALKQMLVNMESSKNNALDATLQVGIPDNMDMIETIAVASPDTWRRQSPFVGIRHTDDSENAGTFRLALSHEFETLAHLRHPNIVSVLDYGFDEHKMPFFTMPMIDAPESLTDAAKAVNLDTRLTWLAEMLQALAYLHHHKIIHRDLKPDNALLTGTNNIKLLDFGLAVLRERVEKPQDDNDDDEDMISGTIPYMAPELLQGGEPSTKSDLYAFGIIAFEIIAGRYPFEFTGVGELVMKLITETPKVKDLDVAEPIQNWIERLVRLDDTRRADDALEALKDLASITEARIPIETKTIQESYLQTARFVGRNDELRQLQEGLKATLTGQGKSFLISGDEGVGKSRLLNELRIIALVNGFQVLQGHSSQGNLLLHQILREPIKRLLLTTSITAAEANVLKRLLPDLEEILGRSVPEVIEDDVSKYGSQLSGVILRLFKEQRVPTLLILDDVHLATESLDIISNLIATVPESRLMVVASQRNSDTSEVVTGKLRGMEEIILERLPDDAVARLAQSILGDGGLRADIQEVLKQEAQGNAHFLLEVIRALLDNVQNIRDIAMMRLPQEITAGGINRVLAGRLAKISGQSRDLFNLIAANGLTIDLKLLEELSTTFEIYHEDWLTQLVNFAIIEREGEEWQITHERLRYVALDAIDPDGLIHLHATIAETLEQIYPESIEKAGIIAYHWHLAGNEERERPYVLDAADYALQLNSFQDAMRHYHRALDLRDDSDDPVTNALIHIRLGQSLMYVGSYEEAKSEISTGLDLLPDSEAIEKTRALQLLADVLWNAGQFEDARDIAQMALTQAKANKMVDVEIRCLARLGMVATDLGLRDEVEPYYQEGLQLAEEHHDAVGKTMILNNYGIFFNTSGNHEAALEKLEQSLELSEQNDWAYRTVSTLINIGITNGMNGDLDAAHDYFEQSLIISRSIGDRRHMALALDNLGFVAKLRQNYKQALRYYEEGLMIAETVGNRVGVTRNLYNIGVMFEAMDDYDAARAYLMQALRSALSLKAEPDVMAALSVLALIDENAENAVTWAQFVIDSGTARPDAINYAEKTIEQWHKKIDQAVLDSYRAAAESFDVDTLLD